jgi:hypothetical protein
VPAGTQSAQNELVFHVLQAVFSVCKGQGPGLRWDDDISIGTLASWWRQFMNGLLRTTLLTALLCALTSAHANLSSSTNFTLKSAVINNGGGEMASANFRLNGSLGEAAIGGASSANFGLNGGFFASLGGVPSILNLMAVFSRKVHGAAGSFDIPVDINQAITGALSVEPRAIGSGHTLHFDFGAPVSVAGTANAFNAANASIGSASAMASGNFVIVTLNGIADNQRVRVALSGVNGATNAQASLAFLRGDVDFSRAVSSIDINAAKSRAGQAVTATNFRHDINTTGRIGAADIAAVKARSGTTLP